MTTHKFNKAEFDSRRQAKDDLLLPHTPSMSVVGLRDRVDLVEVMVGVMAG